ETPALDCRPIPANPMLPFPSNHGALFMPRKRVAITIGELELLIQSVTPETVAEIPFIAPAHAELREILEETRQLMAERDRYTALKQEATRKIQEKLEEGCRAATLVRTSLRYRYGNRPEPLAAFRIKPAHGRPRGRKAAEAQADPPADQGESPSAES
ncbi:MAG TPA: hypothetical protein VLE27_00050, partial [Thermoanaerobaculia bacterium]|nr:hypothetical protein [Thermoanaerobaculia bacterium]